MATTYAAFITALANLTITGVTRKYALNDTPPSHINQVPAQWVRPAGGLDHTPITFASDNAWPIHHATLIVAIESIAQNTAPANYATTVAMVDSVNAALLTAHNANTLCSEGIHWRITTGILAMGESNNYWAVEAEVTSDG